MAEEIKIEDVEKSRRSAIKTAAQVAVTAPAIGLLLSAGTKSAMAQAAYQQHIDVATADDNGEDDGFQNADTTD